MSPRRAALRQGVEASPAKRPWTRLPLGLWLGFAGVPLLVGTAAAGEPVRGDTTSEQRPLRVTPSVPPLPAEYVTEDAGWLRIGYHPSARDRLRVVMPRLDEIRSELRAALGADVLDDVELRIAALDGEMVRLTPGEVAPPPAGEAFLEQRLVVLSAGAKIGGEPQDLESAIRYQLARLALAEAVARPSASDAAGAGGARSSDREERSTAAIPRWFEEGFATHFSRSHEASRAESLLLAWVRDDLPHVADLGSGAASSDRQAAFAADFVRFVSDTRERGALPEVVEKLRRGTELDEAVAEALGSDRVGVDRAWRSDMARRYALFPVIALSVVLWLALWIVGLVRRRRAIAASESTAARLRALRRSRASDAGPLLIVSRARRDLAASEDEEALDDAPLARGVLADGPRVDALRPSRDRVDRLRADGVSADGGRSDRLDDAGIGAERAEGSRTEGGDGRSRDGAAIDPIRPDGLESDAAGASARARAEHGAGEAGSNARASSTERGPSGSREGRAGEARVDVPKIEHDGDWHTLH